MQCIKNPPQAAACGGVVGVWRFELQASWSRTKRATICAIPRKKTAAHRLPLWLRKKDSNPHNTSQSRRCYHYTIPHRTLFSSALLLYHAISLCQHLFYKILLFLHPAQGLHFVCESDRISNRTKHAGMPAHFTRMVEHLWQNSNMRSRSASRCCRRTRTDGSVSLTW